MIIREDAIYGRQSVDRKDSISIESQIEFCKYELRGGNFRKYTDKGYSGKNHDGNFSGIQCRVRFFHGKV